MGTPNACNSCHRDQDAQWHWTSCAPGACNFAIPAPFRPRSSVSTWAIVAWCRRCRRWRMTRCTAHLARHRHGGGCPDRRQDAIQTVTSVLYDPDPILRASAVRSLQFLPLNQRYQLLQAPDR